MSSENTSDGARESPPARTTEERLAELERRGILVPPTGPMKPLRPITHSPGALERFLASRNRDFDDLMTGSD